MAFRVASYPCDTVIKPQLELETVCMWRVIPGNILADALLQYNSAEMCFGLTTYTFCAGGLLVSLLGLSLYECFEDTAL